MENKENENNKHKTLNIIFGIVIGVLLASTCVLIGTTVNNSIKLGQVQTKVQEQEETIASLTKTVEDQVDTINQLGDELNKVKNTFMVYYVVEDSVIYQEEVIKGNNVKKVPQVPTKDNYFSSWSKDGTNIQGNTIITVQYTPKEFNINYHFSKYNYFDAGLFYESEDYSIYKDSSRMWVISKDSIDVNRKFTVRNIDNDPISYQFTDTDDSYTIIQHLTDGYDDYDFTGWGFNTFDRWGDFTKEWGADYYISFDNTYVFKKVNDINQNIGNTYFVFENNKTTKLQFNDEMTAFTYIKDGVTKEGNLLYYTAKIDETIYKVDYATSKAWKKDNATGLIEEVSLVDGQIKILYNSTEYLAKLDSFKSNIYFFGNVSYNPKATAKLPTKYKYGDTVYIEDIGNEFDGYIMDDPSNPYEYALIPTQDFGTFSFDYFAGIGYNSKYVAGTVDTFISNPTGKVTLYMVPTPPLS